MRKIIATLFIMLITTIPASAENITKFLNNQHVNTEAISISVKEVESGKTIYSHNDKTPKNPASTLKLITAAAAVDTLGYDYKFSTKLYKSTDNNLYLKLGADPFLNAGNLAALMKTAKEKNIVEPKHVYIDNTIFNNVEWGEGWQWDDDLNPLMPKFSSYNLDNNILNIEIVPLKNGVAPSIIVKPFFPVTIMNLATTDLKGINHIKAERNNNISPNIINISGTVAKKEVLRIPVNNPQVYFNLRLNEAIQNEKIDYDGSLYSAVLPEKNIYLVDEINNDIELGLREILKNSNNLTAETVFKLAGAKYSNSTGSFDNSLKMLNQYFEKMQIASDDVKIVDGSGVSKNNLITAYFMTNFLVAFAKNENFALFKEYMPIPGEGTLKNRMLYFKENLRAKTGTLSNSSAIAGYIKTRKGKLYAFDIMIQDAKTTMADKKNIEEQILRLLYMN